MSGGVDSSVAAWRLKEQGYECVGVHMQTGLGEAEIGHEVQDAADRVAGECSPATGDSSCASGGGCAAEGASGARQVAEQLGIPLEVLSFRAEFERIIVHFVDEYVRGRTPNPCVICNRRVKFGRLLDYADSVGAAFIATGHYARVLRQGGEVFLARSQNRPKDQSYVLFGIRRERLSRCLLPLGEMDDKAAVRRIAADLGLTAHNRPESQEICFVPDNDYRALVRARRPDAVRTGEVRDSEGRVLGSHEGVVNYTIGQRRGLGIAAGTPIYVTRLDAATNTVIVGPREELHADGLIAERLNWLTDPPPAGLWCSGQVQIRYHHAAVPGTFRRLDDGTLEVRFGRPQAAVTPGQAVVLYREDGVVLGGGWIARSTTRGDD